MCIPRYRADVPLNAPCPLVALRAVCDPHAPTLSELNEWSERFDMTPLAFSCMYSDRSISRMWTLLNVRTRMR